MNSKEEKFFIRVWEYPYVYFHLRDYICKLPQQSQPLVVDLGSAVTFFPFSVAKLVYKVICADIDGLCERDLGLASRCIPHSPGTVDFRLIDTRCLPFKDSQCDALYCISVLEHVDELGKMVAEMARILKPGGLCVITCDINLRPKGGLQLNHHQFNRLLSCIEKDFLRIWPDYTIHPVDVLTSINSPYPLSGGSCKLLRIGYRLIKQKIIKPLLGRKPGSVSTTFPYLAVYGLALKKRDILSTGDGCLSST